MKKKTKYILIFLPIFSIILYFIIDIALYVIEDYLEVNKYWICIYNFTNDDIDISMNNKIIKTIESRTFVMDNILYKYDDNRIFNYKIKINGKTILDNEYGYYDIAQSFSASGGYITEIEVHKLDVEDYEIRFLTGRIGRDEKNSNWLGLKLIQRKYFRDIFNRNGLN